MTKPVSKLIEEIERKAFLSLLEGRTKGCSQAVLLSIQETMGEVDKLMIKACGPMAGGSRVGSLCGALVGGLLAIGMKYGPDYEETADFEKLRASYDYVGRLYSTFEEMFGSRFCPEIIGYDLNIPEEREKWLEEGGWESCAVLCGKTARAAAEIIYLG